MAQFQQLRFKEGDRLRRTQESGRYLLPKLTYTVSVFHKRIQKGMMTLSMLSGMSDVG